MDNLVHTYEEYKRTDFEIDMYKERRRRQREHEHKIYIRNQRILGAVLITASILLLPLHQEGMLVVFCTMLGIMPWIPEKRR